MLESLKRVRLFLGILFTLVVAAAGAGVVFYGEYTTRYQYLDGQRKSIQAGISEMDAQLARLQVSLDAMNSIITRQQDDLAHIGNVNQQARQIFFNQLETVKDDVKTWHEKYNAALTNVSGMIQGLQTDVENLNTQKLVVLQQELEALKDSRIPALQSDIEKIQEASQQKIKEYVVERQAQAPGVPQEIKLELREQSVVGAVQRVQ